MHAQFVVQGVTVQTLTPTSAADTARVCEAMIREFTDYDGPPVRILLGHSEEGKWSIDVEIAAHVQVLDNPGLLAAYMRARAQRALTHAGFALALSG